MFCQCGCGEKATIAVNSNKSRGWIKGQPEQYKRGHGRRPTNNSLLESIAYEGDFTKECLTGVGYLKPDGYRQVSLDGKQPYIHRAVYEYVVGPVPEGMEVHHKCFTRDCYNYTHLEVVTPTVNKQIRKGK